MLIFVRIIGLHSACGILLQYLSDETTAILRPPSLNLSNHDHATTLVGH